MQIEYYTKTVYGNENWYILDKAISEAVQTLTGRKTITTTDMEALKTFNCTFKEVLPPKQ